MPDRPGLPTSRTRLDRLDAPIAAHSTVSGRAMVIGLVAAVLLLWLGLELAFRAWKADYDALAAFGAAEVAPSVDPLAELAIPDVPPQSWTHAVAETHAMLVALTASGALDRDRLIELRDDLRARVARARPQTAKATLASIWDDLQRDAGPLIAPDLATSPPRGRHVQRHRRPPRPELLNPAANQSTR
jgi:hypothetical protein